MGNIAQLSRKVLLKIPDANRQEVEELSILLDKTQDMALLGASATGSPTMPIATPPPSGNPKYFRLSGEAHDASMIYNAGMFWYSDNLSTLVTQIDNAGYIFNEQGSDIDFKIEGDTDTQLFNLDAGSDVIAMGGAVDASYKFKVHGATAIDGDLTFIGAQKIATTAGDFTIDSAGNFVIQDATIIDVTGTEALLVRKNSDGGDIFTVDTNTPKVIIDANLEFTGPQTIDTSSGDLTLSAASVVAVTDHINLTSGKQIQSGGVQVFTADATTVYFGASGTWTGGLQFFPGAGLTMTISQNQRVVIGTPTALGKLHVAQGSTTAAIECLHMFQADVDVEFIEFQGSAASGDLTRSIVDDGDVTSVTLAGWLKHKVTDYGNQITDQEYFQPLYTLDTTPTNGFAGNIVEKSSGYTATAKDFGIMCDASGGGFTITLPAAGSHTGRVYHIKKIDSSGNIVTVDGASSETIDDATTAVLTTQYESVTIICDSDEWFII